jgi:hypothetical protein
MSTPDALKLTFAKVAADRPGTYAALSAMALAAGAMLAAGAEPGGWHMVAVALGGLAVKAPVSYLSQRLEILGRRLCQLT